MTTETKSSLPKLGQDSPDAAKSEGDKVGVKIDAAFEKLTKKMRDRADKAKTKLGEVKRPDKRAVLLRRFELYADAAAYLEERRVRRQDHSE